MFSYCLFDLDGTLTDSSEGITKSVKYALESFGIIEEDLDKLRPFIGPPLRASFKNFYQMDDEQAERAVEKYRERYKPIGIYENSVYPGVPELLKTLKEKGVHLAVASSKPHVMVDQVLEHFDIKDAFEVIIGSELDGSRESKEEIVEEALRRLGILDMPLSERKDKCAMIGDREFDMNGARAHGLTGVGVYYGFADDGELEAAGADQVVWTVQELMEYLV